MITNEQVKEMTNQYYNTGIGKKEIRSYEVSLWTLQDEFITVLKWSDVEQKGRIEKAEMTLNIDGTQELSFSIPMYYYSNGQRIVNPNWYNVENDILITGLRKIKVIFNKYEPDEAVYEFLIMSVDEVHNEDQSLVCEVKCEGLAFHELGKIGYKINLSTNNFYLKYKKWIDSGSTENEPIQDLDYWCSDKDCLNLKKISRIEDIVNAQEWYYMVNMDQSSFDSTGISRSNEKVYEEIYTTSWDLNLNPIAQEPYKVKARPIEASNSNIYNITQTIAETFGIFCRYEYIHDSNYHISGRVIVFYNNFFQETGRETLSFTYPYDIKHINRNMDSTNLTTKLYVLDVDDDTTLGGYHSIMNAEVNKTQEDYVLNFEYLHDIKSITDEQYEAIKPYETAMKNFNSAIAPLQQNLKAYQAQLPEVKAKVTVYERSKKLAQEQIDSNKRLMEALDSKDADPNDGFITVSEGNPDQGIIVEDLVNGNYIKLNTNRGIQLSTLKIYKTWDSTAAAGSKLQNSIAYTIPVYDDFNNLEKVRVPVAISNTSSNKVYLTYKYNPRLYYDSIIKSWEVRREEDEKKYQEQKVILGEEKDTAANKPATGLYKLIDDIENSIDEQIELKNKAITKFNQMMGPALREGYWQPEDYNDYGEAKTCKKPFTETYDASIMKNDTKQDGEVGWDTELFDQEQDIYYEKASANYEKVYYPCVNLSSIYYKLTNNITEYSFYFNTNYQNDSSGTNNQYIQSFSVGSKAILSFVKNRAGTIFPALILIGAKTFSDEEIQKMRNTDSSIRYGHPRFGIITTAYNNNNVQVTYTDPHNIENNSYWTFGGDSISQCEVVMPRIKFSSLNLKTGDNDFILRYNNLLLKNYEDYYILTRNNKDNQYNPEYFITIKPEVLMRSKTITGQLEAHYNISNANTSIYLDALEIAKENAYPKVSYEVDVNILNRQIAHTLYNKLAQLVMINDTDLKFSDVYGYISQVNLDLDQPQNDRIEVKNYKTKFEDLFSNIIAQTEQMKRASNNLGVVLGGNAPLSNTGFQSTLSTNETILNAYLDSYFDSSRVVEDKLSDLFREAGEILGNSNQTLNRMHALTENNASILSSFAQNIAQELTPKVYRQQTRPEDFKTGDIWIQTDAQGKEIARYLSMTNASTSGEGETAGFVRTYDGGLASITGAALNINADDGIIELTAQNSIQLKSGKEVYIAADDNVTIVGNKRVDIGGTIINLCTLYKREINPITGELTTLTGNDNKVETTGINLIAGAYSEDGTYDNETARVLIKPHNIELGAAELSLKAASQMNFISSLGNTPNTSVVHISSDDGIWIGSGQAVRIFSGDVEIDESTGQVNTNVISATGASIELNSEHLILGYANTQTNNATAIEMTEDYMIIAKGQKVTGDTTVDTNLTITGQTTNNNVNSLIGAKFTSESIGFATQDNSTINAVIMNYKGVTIGSADGGINLAISTDQQLRDYFAGSYDSNGNYIKNTKGSYTRISPNGIELGSLADLYINTDNIKLQTHSRDKNSNPNFSEGHTVLAIGSKLQSVGYNTVYDYSQDKFKDQGSQSYYSKQPEINLLLNNQGLYIKGNVYADTFVANCTNGYFKANGSSLGFYNTSDEAILTIGNDGTITASKRLSITANDLYIGSNSFAKIKQDMEDAAIVESIVLYKITDSKTYSNSNPGITGSGTTNVDSDWTQDIPTVNSTKKYLWSVLRNKNGAGIYTYGTPQFEGMLSEQFTDTYTEYTRYSSNTGLTNNTTGVTWSKYIPYASSVTTGSGANYDVYSASVGNYIWRRQVTVKNSGTTYGNPVYDQMLSGASAAAIDALNIASGNISVPHVSTTGIEIKKDASGNGIMNITSTGILTVEGNSSLSLYSSSSNNAMILNANGISIATGQSIGIAAGGSISLNTINSQNQVVNAVKLDQTGIDISSYGKLKVTSSNFILDSSSSTNILQLKKSVTNNGTVSYVPVLTYHATNGLTIEGAVTATSLSVGSGDNLLTYTSSAGLTVKGKITAITLLVGKDDNLLTYDSTNGLIVKGKITATTLSVGSDDNLLSYDSTNGLVVKGNITATTLSVGKDSNLLTYDSTNGLVVKGKITATTFTLGDGVTIPWDNISNKPTIPNPDDFGVNGIGWVKWPSSSNNYYVSLTSSSSDSNVQGILIGVSEAAGVTQHLIVPESASSSNTIVDISRSGIYLDQPYSWSTTNYYISGGQFVHDDDVRKSWYKIPKNVTTIGSNVNISNTADGGNKFPYNCWAYIGGNWFHFDSSGYAEAGTQKIGNQYYYFNSNCQLVSPSIHLTQNGLELTGPRIMLNGKDVWGRDDIVILKKGESQSTIEAQMQNSHDWVLIKPYYNASVEAYGEIIGRSTDGEQIMESDKDILSYNYSEVEAFGTISGEEGYHYEMDLYLRTSTGEEKDFSLTVALTNQNSGSSISGTIAGKINGYSWKSVTVNSSTNLLTSPSGTLILTAKSNGTSARAVVKQGYIKCTCDATTSRVPCVVFYYP